MKIQCDVCGKEEASLFCSADEAALCDSCDRRVHLANKLAGKHNRFFILPSPNNFPLCDICKEKRGLLFCQQDRTVLCKDCDIQIHKANEHTQNHSRFVLTGVKLTSVYSSSLSSSSVTSNRVVPSATSSLVNKSVNPDVPPRVAEIQASLTISEYLIETLPGWHVEDFLDSSSTSPPNFIKAGDCDLVSFWDADLEENLSCKENMGILVPEAAPTSLHTISSNQYMNMDMDNITKGKIELRESRRKRTNTNDCFNVPHIPPPSSTTTKKIRTSWY